MRMRKLSVIIIFSAGLLVGLLCQFDDISPILVPELQNFKLIKTVQKAKLAVLLKEIESQEDIFSFHPNLNQMYYPAVLDTQSVSLQSNDLEHRFPLIMNYLQDLANETQRKLERVTLVRLKPHGIVRMHRDEGEYYRGKDRYHLVLRSVNGSDMMCGDSNIENISMKEGEIWWLNNKLLHSAQNPSDEWRIHAIFDLTQTGFWQKPSMSI